MLRFNRTPVITLLHTEAGIVNAKASYTVSDGAVTYNMEISRYTDSQHVTIQSVSTDNRWDKDKQYCKVGKTTKGYYTTWKYGWRREKSKRIYLPDDFQARYGWGRDG